MPQLTLPFDPAIGPIVPVEIGFPASVHSSPGPPARQAARFLIDSGATATSITPAIAATLNLPVLGLRTIVSVSHRVQAKEYFGDMFLPLGNSHVPLKDLRFVEFPMGTANVEGLLGRDLLQHGTLYMNGPARFFTISF